MFTDFILNGRGNGLVAQQLEQVRFDPGLMRPFFDSRGRACVTVNTGRMETRKAADGQVILNAEGNPAEFPVYETHYVRDYLTRGLGNPVMNATALRKQEWIQLDQVVLRAARQRLRAWADLAGANTFGGFDGMSKLILEHETMSDEGEAVEDMDGLAEERNFEPRFQLEGLPLPITHAGWFLSRRRLAVSRNTNTPLDTVKAEMAGRRVAEKIEKTTIGVITGMTYGKANDYSRAPTVYGYTNFPARITKTDMVAPTGSNGPAVLGSWLALRDLLYAHNFFGPYMVYVSNDWDTYLDNLFSTAQPSAGTLRSRLLEVDGIQDIRRLDYLTNQFTVLMVQMTSDVARAIVGMPINTVQWEEKGGFLLKFRTLTIQVPQLRADYNGNCGIAHGTTA